MRKKRFIKRVNDFLNRFLLVLLVPLFFTVFYQKMQIEEMSWKYQYGGITTDRNSWQKRLVQGQEKNC